MIRDIQETDFETLESFTLKWRWTDSRWNKLPDEHLRKIRPLNYKKAQEFNSFSIKFASIGGLLQSELVGIEHISTSADEEEVASWLKEKSIESGEKVIVSWDDNLAVFVDWGTFCEYWDDFCYPASDDVAIFPIDGAWMLFYFHDEYFEFGRLKTEF